MKMVLMVNTRGRVVSVKLDQVEELGTKGFKEAPKDSVAGQYLKEYDVLSSKPAPEPEAEEKPAPKKRRKRRAKKA